MAANPQYMNLRVGEAGRKAPPPTMLGSILSRTPTATAIPTLTMFDDGLITRTPQGRALRDVRLLLDYNARMQAELLSRVLPRLVKIRTLTELPATDYSASDVGLDSLFERIYSFASLEDGWDGYSGKAPPHSAIDDAAKFIGILRRRALPLHPSVDSSGEVSLFLRDPKKYLEIGIPGDNTYSFFGIDAEGKKFYGDDREVSGARKDQELQKLLSIA